MRPHPRLRALLPLLGALIAATGCNLHGPLPDPATPAPAVQSDGPPVTEEEAREFAVQLAQAVRDRDGERFDQVFRYSEWMERLFSDLHLSANERREFKTAVRDLSPKARLSGQILAAVADGGSYKLVRVHTVDGRPRLLFRLLLSERGVNYHDYTLARLADGGLGVDDVYLFAVAEPMSQTMRRLLIPLVAKGRKNAQSAAKDGTDLSALAAAVREKKPAEAIEVYRRLPRELQDSKVVLLLYAQAVQDQEPDNDEAYLTVLEKFRKLFPNDSAGDMVLLDYYYLKKQYDKALASLNRIDKALGGDAYLGGLRGGLLMEAGRLGEARVAMEKAIALEPDLDAPYWFRITLSLREKKFDDTLAWLKMLARAVKEPVECPEDNEEYDEFLESPQYREWQKWYAAQAKTPAKK